jgi:hypothetical protein
MNKEVRIQLVQGMQIQEGREDPQKNKEISCPCWMFSLGSWKLLMYLENTFLSLSMKLCPFRKEKTKLFLL